MLKLAGEFRALNATQKRAFAAAFLGWMLDGFDFTILALIVAVVGGLGSVAGAFLAGVLLGIVSTVSAFYIGQYITTIVLLAATALTIVMRPRGLLGR